MRNWEEIKHLATETQEHEHHAYPKGIEIRPINANPECFAARGFSMLITPQKVVQPRAFSGSQILSCFENDITALFFRGINCYHRLQPPLVMHQFLFTTYYLRLTIRLINGIIQRIPCSIRIITHYQFMN